MDFCGNYLRNYWKFTKMTAARSELCEELLGNRHLCKKIVELFAELLLFVELWAELCEELLGTLDATYPPVARK